MKIETGTVIPAGYMMTFLTWENDGDHYKETNIMGLEYEEVEYLSRLMPLFASKNCRKNKGYGNADFNDDIVFELIEKTQESEREMLEKFFAIKVPADFKHMADDELVSYDEDDVRMKIQKITGTPVEYDYDFIRVMDTVRVYEFASEFVIPKLPEGRTVFKR